MGERNSVTSGKSSQYKIHFSAAGWKEKKKEDRTDYVFEHHNGSILLSNSFCNEFQDQPLEKLAQKTFKGIKDFRVTDQHYTTFNKREAYRISGTGAVDGVIVNLIVLNSRRNNCYFDFVSISPLGEDATKNFEQFLRSVVFQ
jgi:hypothetical protein